MRSMVIVIYLEVALFMQPHCIATRIVRLLRVTDGESCPTSLLLSLPEEIIRPQQSHISLQIQVWLLISIPELAKNV